MPRVIDIITNRVDATIQHVTSASFFNKVETLAKYTAGHGIYQVSILPFEESDRFVVVRVRIGSVAFRPMRPALQEYAASLSSQTFQGHSYRAKINEPSGSAARSWSASLEVIVPRNLPFHWALGNS